MTETPNSAGSPMFGSCVDDEAHDFSYQEVMQVYNALGATEKQKAELRPIIRQKRDSLLLKHRGDEVRAVEAQ